jgi:hypothetical protein
MREFPFPYVTVTDQFGHMVDIVSVSEAAVWLVAHWPIRRGDQHQQAKQICVMHLLESALVRTVGTLLLRLPERPASTLRTSGFRPFYHYR